MSFFFADDVVTCYELLVADGIRYIFVDKWSALLYLFLFIISI